MPHHAAAAASLPPPAPDALAHSARLVARLREAIAEHDGFLPFARYMELALYAPGLGYYSAGLQKFGAAGDFVTAPELSPLFGRCLARQCAEVLRALDGGVILELGAGSGKLATDVLAELQALNCLPTDYWILEVSADLRERQQRLLHTRVPQLAARVRWLDALPGTPWRGVVLGNEVLDALPVDRFCVRAGNAYQQGVTWSDEQLQWAQRPATAKLQSAITALRADLPQPWPDEYCAEYSPTLAPLLTSLAEHLAAGMLLFVDYGAPRAALYHPERTDGTLLCHYRQRAHSDPFFLPGLQDITAWVDFTAVAEAGVAAGLEMLGYTTQAHFLLGCGLDALLADNTVEVTPARLEQLQQAKRLTLPDEMGEQFKAIALGRGPDLQPCGFALHDLSHTL